MVIVGSIGSSSRAEVGGKLACIAHGNPWSLRSGKSNPESAGHAHAPCQRRAVESIRHHDAGTFNARYGGVDITISASE